MKRPKYFLFPGIVAIVALICFALVYYVIIEGTLLPLYIGLIFIIPFLVFAVIAVLAYTGHIPPMASHITTAILIPVLAVASAVIFTVILFVAATMECTDPAYYEKVYDMYEIYSVFPEEIPEDAEDVEFVYYPSFLQGSGKIYLKYSDDASDIEAIGEKLAEDAVWWGDFGEFSEWKDRPSYFGEYDFLHEASLSDDTVMYLMEFGNAYDPDEGGYEWWNHGTYTVVAITPDSEIIYKSTWW